GMQVVGHDPGSDVEEPGEMPDALGERGEGLVVLEVADVVGDEGVVTLGQAEGALELGAGGEHGPGERPQQAQRPGGVAPGAPQDKLPAPERPGDRVVGPDVDGPVVG